MKELTECKDLFRHPRVEAAYKGLGCHKWISMHGYVAGTLAEVAFEMRDACISHDCRHGGFMGHDWRSWVSKLTGQDFSDCLLLSDPRHWIIAATFTWENRNV